MTPRAWFLGAVVFSVRSLAAVAGYDVSALATVTVRSPLPGDVAQAVTTDVELDPSAQGFLQFTRGRLSLTYAPRILIREPQIRARLLPLHQGMVTLSHSVDEVSFQFTQEGAYGVADIGSLQLPAGGRPGGVFEVQTLGAVPYVRSASLLSFAVRAPPSFNLSLSGGYLVSGDPSGGIALPLQHGPIAHAIGTVRLSSRVSLITDVRATHSWFNTGAQQHIVTIAEDVQVMLSRVTRLVVGAGVAWTQEKVVEVQGGPRPGLFSEFLPVAVATLNTTLDIDHLPLVVDAGLQMAPFADRFTGFIYERLEGRVGATARLGREWSVGGSAGFGYAIPLGRAEQAGDRAIFADGVVTWNATSWLSFSTTARIVSTDQPRLEVPGQMLWAVAGSVLVRDRDTVAW
jgi:hypothetical protein